MMKNIENPFIVLVDEQLSSVIFVQNYLQLDFDGKKLTCYDWPIVVLLKGSYNINNSEYRNILCSLIARKVSEAILIDNETFDINFQSGEQIKFNLKDAKGEVIYFTTPEGEWSSV